MASTNRWERWDDEDLTAVAICAQTALKRGDVGLFEVLLKTGFAAAARFPRLKYVQIGCARQALPGAMKALVGQLEPGHMDPQTVTTFLKRVLKHGQCKVPILEAMLPLVAPGRVGDLPNADDLVRTALSKRNFEAARWLVVHGVDATIPSRAGKTLLHVAASIQGLSRAASIEATEFAFELLGPAIDVGALAAYSRDYKMTASEVAIAYDNSVCLQLLLQAGAGFTTGHDDNKSLVLVAVSHSAVDCLDWLLWDPANNLEQWEGMTESEIVRDVAGLVVHTGWGCLTATKAGNMIYTRIKEKARWSQRRSDWVQATVTAALDRDAAEAAMAEAEAEAPPKKHKRV